LDKLFLRKNTPFQENFDTKYQSTLIKVDNATLKSIVTTTNHLSTEQLGQLHLEYEKITMRKEETHSHETTTRKAEKSKAVFTPHTYRPVEKMINFFLF